LSKRTKPQHEVATRICQTFSQAGNAERLARSSSDENIDICIVTSLDRCEVPVQRDVGVVVRQHLARELVYL
jgi:hypothetical protein